jgi:1,4-dihydroxy-6-naphthoate synthase
MFYAMSAGKVTAPELEFEHVLQDIETLNQRAVEGVYDLTAVSFHAYPSVRKRYRLLTCGASVGDGYGPLVVSKRPVTPRDLDEVTTAVPGLRTTAYLAFKLLAPHARTKVVPFDQIMGEVVKGNVDCGLIIHEGQLTFMKERLHRVIDLGEWWTRETGLPLPLGGNAIRRDIDRPTAARVSDALRDSIRYALEHRAEALEHAMQYARGMEKSVADRFVGMYVNEFTVELGKKGENAVALLLRLGHEAGIIPEFVEPEFMD